MQVERLSDITNLEGTHLYDYVLALDRKVGTYHEYPVSKLVWPRQPKPGPKARRLWTKHIHRILLQQDGRLRFPLGKWTTQVEARDRHYPTIYHAHRQLIHQFDGRVCQQFPISKTTRRCIVAKKSDNPQYSRHPPGYPVDIIRQHQNELTAAYQSRNIIAIVTRSPQQHPLFGHIPDWQNDLRCDSLQSTTNTYNC
jgi:hypothetical protein